MTEATLSIHEIKSQVENEVGRILTLLGPSLTSQEFQVFWEDSLRPLLREAKPIRRTYLGRDENNEPMYEEHISEEAYMLLDARLTLVNTIRNQAMRLFEAREEVYGAEVARNDLNAFTEYLVLGAINSLNSVAEAEAVA